MASKIIIIGILIGVVDVLVRLRWFVPSTTSVRLNWKSIRVARINDLLNDKTGHPFPASVLPKVPSTATKSRRTFRYEDCDPHFRFGDSRRGCACTSRSSCAPQCSYYCCSKDSTRWSHCCRSRPSDRVLERSVPPLDHSVRYLIQSNYVIAHANSNRRMQHP